MRRTERPYRRSFCRDEIPRHCATQTSPSSPPPVNSTFAFSGNRWYPWSLAVRVPIASWEGSLETKLVALSRRDIQGCAETGRGKLPLSVSPSGRLCKIVTQCDPRQMSAVLPLVDLSIAESKQ
ncbi:hypothetical protein MUK42_37406 [Musa troglodytarum]|uniref:Uncharacterized protein n=1 Tax=Musa troglodytarum TaxID=320322 RepID=A0A9E7KLP0_9LILI|nr:hypothetical protein MUK42_37406 [Musa troglodytarum]